MRYFHGLALLCCFCLTAPLAISDENAPSTGSEPALQPRQTQWLDEVRAQREVWETQRKAARQASNARLRMFEPWGAAQLEALDREAESHRQAARNQSEQFRRSSEAKAKAQRRALEWRREEREKRLWQYTPYGWDDPWFYGGY
jgi:hypothetical protein